MRDSTLGETAESPPQKCRKRPSSHANLAGCGGETGKDIPKVDCGNLIGKESEGVSTNCGLEPLEGGPPVAAAAATSSVLHCVYRHVFFFATANTGESRGRSCET